MREASLPVAVFKNFPGPYWPHRDLALTPNSMTDPGMSLDRTYF